MNKNKLKSTVIPLATLLLFAIVVLLVGAGAKNSSAALTDGGFCVTAVYKDGGQTATAGAPACKNAPSTPVVTEPEEPVIYNNWTRMSITVNEAPQLAIGKQAAVTVADAETGEIYAEKKSTISVNGYLNFNLSADYMTENPEGHRDLKITYVLAGVTYEVVAKASDGTTYNGGHGNELGTLYVTRDGIKRSADGGSLNW